MDRGRTPRCLLTWQPWRRPTWGPRACRSAGSASAPPNSPTATTRTRPPASSRPRSRRGVSYFDTAPYYGIGQAELALGAALQELGDAAVTISTKVGRIIDPATGAWHYDYSRDGVLRSLESSLGRLQRDHVDIVYVHDPDDYAAEASATAIPTLLKLRDEGVIGAVGVGMNQWQLPLEFVRNFDLDVILIAGRYSLLDASAAEELFPACLERGVGVVVGGVFNSGILADPSDQATFAYRPAAAELLEKARSMQAVAARHGSPSPMSHRPSAPRTRRAPRCWSG